VLPGDEARAREAVARLRSAAEEARAQILGCRAELARLDPAFSAHVLQAALRMQAALEAVAGRADNLLANQGGTRDRHRRRVEVLLRPLGERQEEVLGPFPFIARHGIQWIEELLLCYEPFGAEHLLVHLDADAPA
jgi:hypothetical protein